MSIQEIRSNLKDYAKDTKLNLGSVLTEEGAEGLTLTQIFGTALASAYATKDADLVEAVLAEGQAQNALSDADIEGAKAATTIMGMNNIYYRFVHLASDKEYAKLPANLRMNIIGKPPVDKVDFEIYSLAVSAINGCGMCIDAHVRELEKHGLSKQAVQSSIRIASVINAVAQAEFIG